MENRAFLIEKAAVWREIGLFQVNVQRTIVRRKVYNFQEGGAHMIFYQVRHF